MPVCIVFFFHDNNVLSQQHIISSFPRILQKADSPRCHLHDILAFSTGILLTPNKLPAYFCQNGIVSLQWDAAQIVIKLAPLCSYILATAVLLFPMA